jgi:hypothetical protein
MNKRMLTIKKLAVLLALGGSTFAAWGPSSQFGCNYADNMDYQTVYDQWGSFFIEDVATDFLGGIGTDFTRYLLNPGIAFGQAAWMNWVDSKMPDDLPNNSIVVR